MSHRKHVHSGTFLLLHIIAIVLLAFSVGFFKKEIFWYKIEGTIIGKILLGGKVSFFYVIFVCLFVKN